MPDAGQELDVVGRSEGSSMEADDRVGLISEDPRRRGLYIPAIPELDNDSAIYELDSRRSPTMNRHSLISRVSGYSLFLRMMGYT